MIHLAQDAKWQVTVTAMDQQLVAGRKSKGCPYCGGRLHSARYPRLLRGESGNAPLSVHRHGFCCETCRKRVTPPSVRFFGRRRIAMTSMLLVSVLRLGQANKAQQDRLRSLLGISKRTLARWRLWWQEAFVRTLAVLPWSHWPQQQPGERSVGVMTRLIAARVRGQVGWPIGGISSHTLEDCVVNDCVIFDHAWYCLRREIPF